MKKIVRTNIVILLIFIIAFAISAEVILGFTYNYRGEQASFKGLNNLSDNEILVYEMIPNAEVFSAGKLYKINSDGFRDKEYPLEHNDYRIAIIGDSITYGYGLNIQETFVKKLESKRDWEVLNFGVSGYNTQQELEFLKTKVLKYNPDMLIIEYSLNDFEDRHFTGRQKESWLVGDLTPKDMNRICEIKTLRLPVPCWLLDLLMKSNFLVFVENKIDIILAKINSDLVVDMEMNQTYYDDYLIGLYLNETKWEINLGYFNEIKEIAEQNDIEVLIVIFPILIDDYKWLWIHDRLNHAFNELGFEVIDLYGILSEDVKLSPEDLIHPNILGQELIAEAIYEKLGGKNG